MPQLHEMYIIELSDFLQRNISSKGRYVRNILYITIIKQFCTMYLSLKQIIDNKYPLCKKRTAV